MTEYRLTEQNHCESVDGYDSYGIALVIDGVIDRVIEDFTFDRDKAESLVRLFNEEGLDPIHFSQAVEDFLLDGEP